MEWKQLELFDENCEPILYDDKKEDIKKTFEPDAITEDQLYEGVVHFERNKNLFTEEERNLYKKIHIIRLQRGMTSHFNQSLEASMEDLPKEVIQRLKEEKRKDDALYEDDTPREDLGNHK